MREPKILLVSDPTKFGLTDVFYGYRFALEKLKIKHDSFPWHHYTDFFSPEICLHMLHSSALLTDRAFTHIMFIGGLNVPQNILSSLYDKKSIVVATEDPHTTKPNLDKLHLMDYYFSNELTIPEVLKSDKIHYCGTAANPNACSKLGPNQISEKYQSDVCFLGALYPNREKMLTAIIPFIKKHNLSFKICGHANFLSKNSPLHEYVFDFRTIPHEETVKYYNGAKVNLNFFRDVTWNPKTNNKKNPHKLRSVKAESLNPRAYELGLCGAFQLLEDTRSEARKVFTEDEVGFFSNPEQLVEKLEYYLVGEGVGKRDSMAINSFKKVVGNHTYTHRLLSILKVIEKDLE
jgi:spore maturation protein CgeB